MKSFLLAFILTFTSALLLFAQNEDNIWLFGVQAGLDFNSGIPVPISGGQTDTHEGSSTISDSDGNLLFYTDGISVWDRNHTIMPNGFDLDGNFSSTQSAIILPQPGNPGIYMIFTTDALGGSGGCCYSVVDMSLNGGYGDVTIKNILLHSPTTEKVAACMHSNGTDYWVITHPLNSGSFNVYPLNATGVGAPVISTVGTFHSGPSCYGQMSYCCKQSKVAVIVNSSEYVNLVDFDPATGILSNSITINNFSGSAYGLEFSPSGDLLYLSTWDTQTLYQFDISSGNATTINNSQEVVGIGQSALGTIQQGPDGKLYLPDWGTNYIAVINDPDSSGLLSNFIDQGLYLGSFGTAYYGLQNFPNCTFIPDPPVTNTQFEASDSMLCEKFCIGFTDQSTNNPTGWQWSFPGGTPSSSSAQNPAQVCYQLPGTYDVTLITTSASGNDTLVLSDYITVYPTPPFPTITQVGYTLTSSPAYSYQWQFNTVDIPGATNQSYDVLQSGYYTVMISDENGCVSSSSTNVLIVGMEEVNAGKNILIYPNPSTGQFTIELINFPVDKFSIQIENMLGQVVAMETNKTLQDGKIKFELASSTPGIYLITLTGEGIFSRKLIIIER